jgi:hypothetical protein
MPKVCASFGFLTIFLLLNGKAAYSQDLYATQKGIISFYSEAPIENIEAKNKDVSAVLNTKTGKVLFKVMIRKFRFPNGTMEEHFNENYLESEKYPTSDFSGVINEAAKIDFTKNGIHNVTVEGDLTLHGVKKRLSVKGTLEVKDGKIYSKSKFPIRLSDYNIEIPKLVIKNIAEVVDVTVDMVYEPYKKP